MSNEVKQPLLISKTLTQALRTTFSPIAVGCTPSNHIGACVPQRFGDTFFSGIFPPAKLVKRYHPHPSPRSHIGSCPASQIALMLRRGSLISMYVEQQEPSLQSTCARQAALLRRATVTMQRIMTTSPKLIVF